jgi:hypothetical protein
VSAERLRNLAGYLEWGKSATSRVFRCPAEHLDAITDVMPRAGVVVTYDQWWTEMLG